MNFTRKNKKEINEKKLKNGIGKQKIENNGKKKQ